MKQSLPLTLLTCTLLSSCSQGNPTDPSQLQAQGKPQAPTISVSTTNPTYLQDNNNLTAYRSNSFTLSAGSDSAINAVDISWQGVGITYKVEGYQANQGWSMISSGDRTSSSTAVQRVNLSGETFSQVRISSLSTTPLTVIEAKLVKGTTTRPAPYPAATRTFYIDCQNGLDTNAGSSPALAWKTLSKASGYSLQAGDHVLLKRGCTFNEQLSIWNQGRATKTSPIVYGAWGDASSAKPVISPLNNDAIIAWNDGSNTVIDSLNARANGLPTGGGGARCPAGILSQKAGFILRGQNITLQNSEASGWMAGVWLHPEGSANRVTGNSLHDNIAMKRNDPDNGDNDSGAWGVLANQNNSEIDNNSFTGNIACSEDYIKDGASIELYGASNNQIHRNKTSNDITFSELGGDSSMGYSRYNTFHHNTYAPVDVGGMMLNLRGASSTWGDNTGTFFYNNVSYLADVGVNCSNGCNSTILDMHHNVIQENVTPRFVTSSTGQLINYIAYTDEPTGEHDNIFWRTDNIRHIYLRQPDGTEGMGPGDQFMDPQFVNPQAGNFSNSLFTLP